MPEKSAPITRSKQKKPQNKSGAQKKVNIWKWAFIVLVALLLGGGIFIVNKVTTPIQANVTAGKTAAKDPTFSVNLTKAQVNSIVGYYLDNYLGSSDVKYTFRLDNQAVLNGEIKVLGAPVNFSLYFDPYVTETGNVELKAKKINIGQLSVPISIVMNYIGSNYHIPSWVSIDSKNNSIVLKLDKFKMKNNMQLKARKIDLDADQIDMEVYLPLSSTK